jgi:glycerophosphoryl diester phosphodiesterase
VNFILDDGGRIIKSEPLIFDAHGWTSMSGGLIAHAGGTLSNAGIEKGRVKGTNSRPAVVYSYNHGHRVFEIDFNLTTDNKLAAVHDWHGYNGAMSSEEWAKVKIWTAFTSMMLEDVLDFMIINKDMFLITDTKSFEYTHEDTEFKFNLIVEAAKKKDPELLDRIIPQIYYQEMYDIVMKQHEFKSIIYTLYASPDDDEQVVNFVRKHRNIRVVTMAPVRGRQEFITELRRAGKQIYFFTLNDLDEILNYKKSGVRGFYTDYIFPGDLK